ncbi:MAG TPA: glycosyltransferase family 4 protein [Candidatus Paceibacterota bacterium]|nr:glycosyltransferase family 4 protein [Candidatus Paceibacterota bacterium]
MRIIIATGIYPPEVGGPALYAKGVRESLEKTGHDAPVVLFSSLKNYPSGVRHVLYVFKLMRAAWGASAIFAFDTYSAGVPTAFVGMLLRKPVVIRIGGDFVWESYIERTHDLVPLPKFYRAPRALSRKERMAKKLVAWMLRHGELAFNTPWLARIWTEPYGLDESRIHTVENVIGPRLERSKETNRSVILYGRQMALKNASAFRTAFEKVRAEGIDLELKEGIVPHAELMELTRSCYAVALPSISDVAPNTIIDALRCGVPFIITKNSGYAEKYKNMGIVIDPLDEADMIRGIKALADPATYERLRANIAAYTTVRTYDDVAHDMLAIIQK